MLEEDLVTFMKVELQKFQSILSPGYSEAVDNHEKQDKGRAEDQEQAKACRETFLKLALHFLRRGKKDDLADCLWNSKNILSDLICRDPHQFFIILF